MPREVRAGSSGACPVLRLGLCPAPGTCQENQLGRAVNSGHVTTLSRSGGGARLGRDALAQRLPDDLHAALRAELLTAFPAPTAMLPRIVPATGQGIRSGTGQGGFPRLRPAARSVGKKPVWCVVRVLWAQDAQQAVLLVVDAGGEPERVGAAGCRGAGQQAPQARLANSLPVKVSRTWPITWCA